MVAQTEGPSEGLDPDAGESAHDPRRHRPDRGGLRRLIASITRLADLQYRIWMIEAKMAVARIALYVALFGAAALVATLGIIFLLIGLFHVLTDVLGLAPVWAFLLFGAFLLLVAGILIAVARSILSKRDDAPRPLDGGKIG